MLFSGRHLAQCLIVWSRCLIVMVSEVCLKLRKQQKAGEIENDNNAPSEAKELVLFPFALTSFPVGGRALQPWVKGRSKPMVYKWPCWDDLTLERPYSLQTRSDVRERQQQTSSPPAHSVLCVYGIQHVFKRTFSLSGSALWPEGSSYTQLANRRFLLLNARLMCLTNSSSQAASTPPVCVRVMAYVTPKQLNKVCSSQLVSLCWRETLRGQSVITATDGLSVYLAYCSN